MSHIGSRRHRLNFDEAPHVYRLVRDRLQQLVMDHKLPLSPNDDKEISPFGEIEGSLFGEALSLFRLAWRMDHNYPGAPRYPELTWSTLEEYLTSVSIDTEVDNDPLEEAGES